MVMRFSGFPFPFSGKIQLDNDINDVKDMMDSFTRPFGQVLSPKLPPLDLVEYPDRYEITAEIPGVAKNDVKISVMGGVIHVTAERKPPTRDGGVRPISRETASGTFRRILRLPGGINRDGITADLENGLLRIIMPKTEEGKLQTISVR